MHDEEKFSFIKDIGESVCCNQNEVAEKDWRNE